MSSETRKKQKRYIVAAVIITFIIGAVAGVGGMTLYSHVKALRQSAKEFADEEKDEKKKEPAVAEIIDIQEESDPEASTAVLEQLDTQIVLQDKKVVEEGASVITGTYDAYYKSCDWGTQLLRVIMTLSAPIDEARADDWIVIEEKEGYDDDDDESEKKITDAFLLTADGERTEKPSNIVGLEFYTAPGEMSPYSYNTRELHYIYAHEYSIKVNLAEGNSVTSKGIEVEEVDLPDSPEEEYRGTDKYEIDEFTSSDDITYYFAHYEPELADGKPAETMVVYLHGLTEGGEESTDPIISASMSNAAILLGEEFQKTMGGASILIPQCPTYWMNQSPTYDDLEWATVNPYIQSWYTGSLHELINYYKDECNAKRVIITGHSNGGFMALLLALHYEDEYDGYVCMSEAMWDKSITEEHTANLAKLPIFFIYCNNDTTAPPLEYSIPTISRIKAHSKKNIHVSSFDSITDVTGTYYDDLGGPYTFDPHQSQIYFFRNNAKCNDCGKSVWEWMATVGK